LPQALGRANEASLAPDRACGRERGRTERVRNVLRRNYRYKREHGAVAFCLRPVAGRARKQGSSLWLRLCARAQQRMRGQGHAPEDNAKPDAVLAAPGPATGCERQASFQTGANGFPGTRAAKI